MLGAAAGIAVGFGFAIKAASDFETRISAIAAVSGATEAELESVRKKALQLGADTKFSAGESAGAMEELVKAGLTVDEVLNGAADATVNLAAAGEVDLVSAATLAANAMNAFGLSAGEMPHIADLIAGAANASAIDVGEFGQSLQQAGAVANLAGLSFDDTALAIAAMGNAGIKGSDAGTSLKTFLQNLQPVTEKQIGLFKELGIVTEDGTNQFYDAQGSVKSMAEISGVLSTALAGMTDQQKQAALETAFGSDAIRAAAIIADTGAQGFDDLATAMGKVSAEDVAKTRMDNLGGSIEQLKGSVETLLIIIGKPLADALKVWADRLTGVVNWISALDPAVLGAVVTVAKMAAAFLGTIGVAIKIATVIPKISAALTALKVVMLAHPIFFIIAALIAVGAALYMLYQRSETFRTAVDNLFGMFKAFALPVIAAIVDAFGKFWTVLTTGFSQDEGGTWFENLAFKIRDVAHWIVNDLVPKLQRLADFFMQKVVPVLADVGGKFLWLASEIVERVVGAFDWLNKNVFPVVKAFGELLWAVGERVGQAIGVVIYAIDKLMPIFNFVFASIKNIVLVAVEIILAIWRRFADNIWAVLQFAFNTVKTVVEAALKVVQGIIQTITGIISGDWGKAWEGIKNVFAGVWDLIAAIPRIALDAIYLIIKTAWNVIATLFSVAWETIKAAFAIAWDGMRRIAGDTIGAVVTFIRELPGKLLGAIGDVAGILYSKGRDLIQGLFRGAIEMKDTVLDWLRALPGAYLRAVGNLADLLLGIGKDIMDGLLRGIKAGFNKVKDFVGGIGGVIKDLKGPIEYDRVMLKDEGIAIMQGLQGAMESQVPALERMLSGISPTIRASVASSNSPLVPAGQGRTSGGVEVALTFNGPYGPDFEERMRSTLRDPSVLSEVIRATRSGSGRL